MRLERVVVHNFGTYKGRHEIELRPRASDRPIVLIGGLNGGGKTTLLDAIQLGLYGKRARCSNRGNLAYDEFLRRSVNRSARQDGAGVEVTFTSVQAGLEREYRLYRSWVADARGAKERFEVYVDGFHDRALATHWQEHMEEILPLEISSLFFFDGEKIEALADPETARSVISTAIAALLGLGLLDRLQADLLVLERRKKAASADSETAEQLRVLLVECESTEKARQEAVQRRASIQSDLDRAQHEVEIAEQDLRQNGGELFSRRSELETKRKGTQLQLELIRHQMKEVAGGAMPLLLVRKQLETLRVKARLEVAAATDAAALQVLKERDANILGLLKEGDATSLVQAFMEQDLDERSARAATPQVLRLPSSASAQLDSLLDHQFGNLREQSLLLLEQDNQMQLEADELDRQLSGVPTEAAIAGLLTQLAAITRRCDLVLDRLEDASGEVERLTKQGEQRIAALNKATEQITAEELEIADVARLLSHSAKARSTVQRFRDVLLERSLGRIEAAVLDSFRSLHRKVGLVTDLRIDAQSFELTLFGADLDPIPAERLSAGERQLLAVALLWGLARVAGRDLPMVIDTPLGRLDSEHRRLLAERYFPHAAGQVLLLSTDEEIDESLLQTLTPSISHAYTLETDPSMHSTDVRSGYFWITEEDSYVA